MILILVLFVQTCMQCFICNAQSKYREVLPANMKLGFVSNWELHDITGLSVLHEIQTSLKSSEKANVGE